MAGFFAVSGLVERVGSPAAVVRLFAHRRGIVIRLREVLTPGIGGKDYLTVMVERARLSCER